MDARKVFHGMGCGVRLTLSFKEFRNELLPIPPLEEQQSMATYLDKATAEIDKAIAQQQRMIDLLNERKQIIIQRCSYERAGRECGNEEFRIELVGTNTITLGIFAVNLCV